MTTTLGITIGAVIGLIALSAFFSGSETALTATSKARMHELTIYQSRPPPVNICILSRQSSTTAKIQWRQ